MKRRCIVGFLNFSLLFACMTAFGQQQSLIGHQDFWGYYNPALMKPGNFSQISFIHRTQWEGFGPTSSLLFFDYPFRFKPKTFSPQSAGAIVQYEDLSFLTRTNFSGFLSGVITSYRGNTLSFGFNLGVQVTGLKIGEFGISELIDPELSNVDSEISTSGRFGLSFRTDLFEVGVGSGVKNFSDFSDLNATVSTVLPLENRKYVLKPIVILRVSESLSKQVEAQTRVVYDNKLSFTVGYRQNFGMLFQLGISLNNQRVKGSYGSELPSNGNSSLGLTHEIFVSAKFETSASKKHTSDSTFKAKRDSLNKLRIDSMRTAKIDELSKQEDVEEESEELEEDEVDLLTIDPAAKKVIEFEDLPIPKDVKDNTHVILGHIGFEISQDIIKPFAYEELDRLATYLLHDHRHRIEIEGHTDSSGSDEHNFDLSKRRAFAVSNYLISRGVSEARITIVGYGDTMPLVPNDSETNRELNRRIEIVFHERKAKDH